MSANFQDQNLIGRLMALKMDAGFSGRRKDEIYYLIAKNFSDTEIIRLKELNNLQSDYNPENYKE